MKHPSLPCRFFPATLHLSGPLHLSHAIPIFLVCPLRPPLSSSLRLTAPDADPSPYADPHPAKAPSSSSAPYTDPPLLPIISVLPLHLYCHRTVLLLEGDLGGGEALVVEEEGLEVMVLGGQADFKDLGRVRKRVRVLEEGRMGKDQGFVVPNRRCQASRQCQAGRRLGGGGG
ncbi:hypothetical protein MRB53_009901 [Persea americana]|uniref:Uncharacterized protein n=1 Tax=Persea americana TaxID=3435 RepID=A0ACC2LQB2_PERAE|nr:hypothetical protein MRB53_009901 [Persea americana]